MLRHADEFGGTGCEQKAEARKFADRGSIQR